MDVGGRTGANVIWALPKVTGSLLAFLDEGGEVTLPSWLAAGRCLLSWWRRRRACCVISLFQDGQQAGRPRRRAASL